MAFLVYYLFRVDSFINDKHVYVKHLTYMSNIKLFESKQIRSIWNEIDKKWYFVVADVIQVLTDTPNPGDYIKKMRKRDEELSKGWGQFVTPLSVDTIGGKQKLICDVANNARR